MGGYFPSVEAVAAYHLRACVDPWFAPEHFLILAGWACLRRFEAVAPGLFGALGVKGVG